MALLPDEPTAEERLEQLPQDNETPFRPADDTGQKVDDTHPQTDTNLQPEEQYEEGIAGAAELTSPRQGIPRFADADHS